MSSVVIQSLPGAGLVSWIGRVVRGWSVKRVLLGLVGVDTVVLQGRVCAVRPRCIRVCRQMIPALLRCSRRFYGNDISEALYDDLVTVLSLGLDVPVAFVESLVVPVWDLAPAIEAIARANALPVMEAGGAGMGECLNALTMSTGMPSAPPSSVQQAGPGVMSITS